MAPIHDPVSKLSALQITSRLLVQLSLQSVSNHKVCEKSSYNQNYILFRLIYQQHKYDTPYNFKAIQKHFLWLASSNFFGALFIPRSYSSTNHVSLHEQIILEFDTVSIDYTKFVPFMKHVMYYFSMSDTGICKHQVLTPP